MAQPYDTSPRVFTLAGIALVITALYFLQEVLLPFALAVLLSFLLSPLVTRLERWRLGRIPAVIVAVTFAFVVLGGILVLVGRQFADVVTDLPKYESNLVARIRSVRGFLNQGSGKVGQTVLDLQEEMTKSPEIEQKGPQQAETAVTEENPLAVRVVEVETSPLPVRILRDWLGPLLGPLGTAAIVIVFVLFMLIQREELRDRLIRLAGTRKVYVTTQALDEAGGRVSRYLLMQLVINATYGIAVAIGLWLLGLPNALLWGLLATVFRFVPYVGPWVAAVLPIALSLAAFEGWARPLATIALFVVLELFSNNVMEPWLYGTSTGVSAVGIIVSATFWTWLWGPIGLVLSMPLTVCLVVLGRYVPQLSFLDVLLSDQPALELSVRFYQRLLAFDDYEANDLVRSFLRTGSLDDLYQKMLIPALSMSERDRHEGHLTEQQARFIHRIISDIIEDQKEQYDLSAAAEAVPPGAAEEAAEHAAEVEPVGQVQRSLRILCLPAEDTADQLAGRMVAQLLSARGHTAETDTLPAAASEATELLERHQADCVIISALAPGGAVPAREGCARLRSRLPNLLIVVGLWNVSGPISGVQDRITRAGANAVVTSLADAIEAVRQASVE